ncbi:hypothetical protein ON003_00440 [Janibacter hoylei]|uniref:hypothetical protein n=1 Tax=Janibacter hoylei TaxID=364298 RepID=UPI002236F843|nr:hypothetical protein [Janibacter hoylei]MCW4600251.1 hypothetical protein [Janibacter hoylei]
MFSQFIASIHVLGLRTSDRLQQQQELVRRAQDERGSVTIEQVLWAVAVIAIAAIVITAVRTFVTNKAGEIG